MPQQDSPSLLALLLKAYNRPVMDFYHFPEVVLIGRQRIEPEEFFQLISEGLLQQTHRDNFGRFYSLTDKAKALLHQSLQQGRGKARKKQLVPAGQGSFLFL